MIERIRRQFDEVVDELQRQQNNINILVVQVNDLTADYAKLYESTERRERDKLAADNERLTAENAALRADGERIDWLEQHDERFFNIDRIAAIVGCGFNGHQDLRYAIDSARAKESGNG